jgi:transposase
VKTTARTIAETVRLSKNPEKENHIENLLIKTVVINSAVPVCFCTCYHMKFITGIDRNQAVLFPVTLDETVDRDNEVRLIDMFVDSLSLQHFGFKTEFAENGRPAYHPSDLLKLYIYGYLNKTRSSRDLEKETKRNIEVIWLLKGLKPDHNTIANFRRDNPKAIKKVFRATVEMAKHFDLIGGKLIAGDSTKLRAQNSKKKQFQPKKDQSSHCVHRAKTRRIQQATFRSR